MSLSTYHVLDIVLDLVGTNPEPQKILRKIIYGKNNMDISYAIITINNSHISPNP